MSSESPTAPQQKETVLRPPSGWNLIDFKELRDYRDLFRFLVWRDIKVLYAQTVLGFTWAILNPFVQIVLYTIVFGRVAGVKTENFPYLLFSTMGVIPWTYMQEAMIASSQSLVQGQAMLGKIYFPRLIFPLTPVLAKLVDFLISLVLLTGIWVYYFATQTEGAEWQLQLTPKLLLLPVFVALMICVPAGFGLWLSSLAIRFRDVKFAMPFMSRMLMFTAPVVYTANEMDPTNRFFYSLNPIVPVIEGFRSCLLDREFQWEYIIPGSIIAIVMLITGAIYFRRMERVFVDVI